MNAPEDPNGLREALPSKALRKEVRDCIGETIPLRRRWVSALMAGPIARLMAERDAAQKLGDEWYAAWEWSNQSAIRQGVKLAAAEAEITRLKEGMEAADPRVIAAAWKAWHARHGGKLGPGPAFVEALQAGLACLATLSPKEHPHG